MKLRESPEFAKCRQAVIDSNVDPIPDDRSVLAPLEYRQAAARRIESMLPQLERDLREPMSDSNLQVAEVRDEVIALRNRLDAQQLTIDDCIDLKAFALLGFRNALDSLDDMFEEAIDDDINEFLLELFAALTNQLRIILRRREIPPETEELVINDLLTWLESEAND